MAKSARTVRIIVTLESSESEESRTDSDVYGILLASDWSVSVKI